MADDGETASAAMQRQLKKSQNPRNVANIMLLCAFGDNMPFKQKSFDGGCILPFMHF